MRCMKEYEGEGSCSYCGFDNRAYEAKPHHLMPGRVLNGRYMLGMVLEERITEIIYLGWDLEQGCKVEVKEYYPSFQWIEDGCIYVRDVCCATRKSRYDRTVTLNSGEEEIFQKGMDIFLKEGSILSQLSNLQGIVPVRDCFQKNGTTYIVRAFQEHEYESLEKLLKKNHGRIPACQVFEMMPPIIKLLEETHKRRLIHGSISPDIITVRPIGRRQQRNLYMAELQGFYGVENYFYHSIGATFVPPERGYEPVSEKDECLMEEEVGPWTDIYELCAVMYRAITGEEPLSAPFRSKTKELELPSKLGVKINRKQEAALIKGLAAEAGDRFASMKELYDALYCEESEKTSTLKLMECESDQNEPESNILESYESEPMYAPESTVKEEKLKFNRCLGCMEEQEESGRCPNCGFDRGSYESVPHQLLPGTILNGRYILGRALGEGGFGISYLGWDLNLECKIAVKEYYPISYVTRQAMYNPTVTVLTGSRQEYYQKGLNKFVEEARSLAKFNRLPGIVMVRDYFQENGTAYIVMEFAEGETLKKMLQNSEGSRLPFELVSEMMRTVMESLEEVHKKGIIHRDISPDNMMIDSNGMVKLLDFGAARNYVSEGQKSLSVVLKPGYTPVEQYRSRGEQGPWTDVYALCATIYRAITGILPPESLDRLSRDEIQPPSSLGVSISIQQERALMKGLSVRKEDRFASMNELKNALYQPDPVPTPVPDPILKPDPVPAPVPDVRLISKRKLGFIILGMIILIACAIGIKSRDDIEKPLGGMVKGGTPASNEDLDITLTKKDFNSKTKVHWEAWTDEQGVRYVGFRNKDGYADGAGKSIYENGDEYEGYFEDGEKKGYGKYTWVNGDWYEGIFDDTMSGFGARYWSKTGKTFHGEWKNGDRNGLGVLHNQNGTYEVGVWKDDNIIEYLEGIPIADRTDSYIFYSDNQELSGRAVIVNDTSEIYIGEVSEQKQNGWGGHFSSNGNYTEGQYKNGKADGILMNYTGNGGSTIAYFSNARVDGPNVWIDPDGGRREGFYNYEEGKEVVGKWIETDGDTGEITTGVTEENGNEIIDTELETWIEGDKMYIGSQKNGDIEGDFINISIDGSHAIENSEQKFRVQFFPFYDGRSDIYFIWGHTESDGWADGALCASRQKDGRIGMSVYKDGEWISEKK